MLIVAHVFSAIRNRAASVGTGLFLEDELEVVGVDHEMEIIEQWKRVQSRQRIDGGEWSNFLSEPKYFFYRKALKVDRITAVQILLPSLR